MPLREARPHPALKLLEDYDRTGDLRHWRTLAAMYAERGFALLGRMSLGYVDRKEVLQEALVELADRAYYRKRKRIVDKKRLRFDPDVHFMLILKNCAARFDRTQQKTDLGLGADANGDRRDRDLPDDWSQGMEPALHFKAHLEAAYLCVKRHLSPKKQEAVLLTWEGLTAGEVARRLGLKAAATRQMIHRLRDDVREELISAEDRRFRECMRRCRRAASDVIKGGDYHGA